MNISIIDIGTKSLKHYIFKLGGIDKEQLHYKRYSDVDLGVDKNISLGTQERLFSAIKNCLEINKNFSVSSLKIVGTEIFRISDQAKQLVTKIKEMTGADVIILDQEKEAFYLYNGFIDLVDDNTIFAGVNIGGGSTEIIVGSKKDLIYFQNLSFGVNFLRNNFGGEIIDWPSLDKYLEQNIKRSDIIVEKVFITGVLDFLYTVAPQLGSKFKKSKIKRHQLYLNIKDYRELVFKLRETPVDFLRSLYPKDPDFANNVAIGQSVYLKVAEKLNVDMVVPSNNDLTDGLIQELDK